MGIIKRIIDKVHSKILAFKNREPRLETSELLRTEVMALRPELESLDVSIKKCIASKDIMINKLKEENRILRMRLQNPDLPDNWYNNFIEIALRRSCESDDN